MIGLGNEHAFAFIAAAMVFSTPIEAAHELDDRNTVEVEAL